MRATNTSLKLKKLKMNSLLNSQVNRLQNWLVCYATKACGAHDILYIATFQKQTIEYNLSLE